MIIRRQGSGLLGNAREETLILAQGSDRHSVAARTGRHTIPDCNVLGSGLNGNCIVTVEDCKTVDQNVGCTVRLDDQSRILSLGAG
jgi:hypothetical protein